jgi:Kef-type K+ transport system membrane component KefB
MSLGFAMLMLGAGTAVDLGSKQLRDGAIRGALALLVTLAASVPLGIAFGIVLQAGHLQLLIVLLGGSSAAVAFPIIQERGLDGPAVAVLIAWMTLSDALTALLMPLTLSGSGHIPAAILGDGLIIVVAAGAVTLGRRLFQTPLADEAKRESKHRSWALQLRISVLLLLALSAISESTGASLLLAGFAAGIVLRQFHEPHRLVHQLTGLATGFFVPAFFVLLGATLGIRSLVNSPSAIALAVAMATGATAVHLLALLATSRYKKLASGLLASAQLGLPAAAAARVPGDHELLALDLVPQVSSWIPDGFIGLCVSASICGPNGDLIRAGLLGSPCELPRPEGILANVFCQAGLMPALSIVIRDFHFLNASSPGEGNALQLQWETRGNLVRSVRRN